MNQNKPTLLRDRAYYHRFFPPDHRPIAGGRVPSDRNLLLANFEVGILEKRASLQQAPSFFVTHGVLRSTLLIPPQHFLATARRWRFGCAGHCPDSIQRRHPRRNDR